jgi:phosphatidylglycerophosphatase A
MPSKIPKKFLRNPIHFVALGFGSGLFPKMPGTFGTLVAIPIYLLLYKLPLSYYAIVVACMFIFGCIICGLTSRDLGHFDHPSIVWDEIVGYLITMIAVPLSWNNIVLGFVLFRIFDIWKPWPIRKLEKTIRGGVGIMLDDVLAAIYAWILLQLLTWIMT